MFALKRLLFLSLIFLPINALAISGYIKTDLSITDKDWSFVPTLTNSFNYSETSANEIFLLKDNFGLIYKTSNFELDLMTWGIHQILVYLFFEDQILIF